MTNPIPPTAALVCARTGCAGAVAVQWHRRLTAAELDAHIAAEQERRQQIMLLADPDQPAPVFGPMPTAADCTRSVYVCGQHALGLDLAAHVHAGTCTAPNNAVLPGCDCTPEPLPVPPAPTSLVTLATGWTVPAH